MPQNMATPSPNAHGAEGEASAAAVGAIDHSAVQFPK